MPLPARALLSDLASQTWAMEPRRLDRLFTELAQMARSNALLAPMGLGDGEPPYLVIDGVAHIAIEGVILKTAPAYSWGEAITGASDVQSAVQAAIMDPSVRAIVLDIDSPGGTIAGVQELADAVFGGRSQKPIAAYCSDLCASAAYWVASQAGKVRANETAQIGSIGVYTMLVDSSGFFEELGFKAHLIASGPHKGIGVPGVAIGENQLKPIQQVIDQTAGLFIDAIARGRGMDRAQVEALATGRSWIAADAKRLGLIDDIALGMEAHQAARTQRRSPAPDAKAKERKMPRNLAAILGALDPEDRAVVETELKAAVPPSPPDLFAGMSAEVRARVEAAEASAKASEAKILEMQEQALAREYSAKAAQFAHLPGLAADDVAAILRAAECGTPMPKAVGEKFVRALAGVNEAMRRSKVFEEHGTTAHAGEGLSAYAQLQLKAKEIRTADPQLSASAAMKQAIAENKTLYLAHVEEQRSASRNARSDSRAEVSDGV